MIPTCDTKPAKPQLFQNFRMVKTSTVKTSVTLNGLPTKNMIFSIFSNEGVTNIYIYMLPPLHQIWLEATVIARP